MSDESGFLSRWSERKQRVAEEAESTKGPAEVLPAEPDPYEGKTDEEILEILELPAPEALTLGDRAEGYLAPNVPEHIRQRALRAFWRTNPVLANVDGLDDYCDDFTDAAMAVENIQTIYEVGKGYAQKALDALESLAEEADATALEAVTDEAVSDALSIESEDENSEELGQLDSPAADAHPAISGPAAADADDDHELNEVEAVVYKPRRMQFRSV